MSRFSEKNTGVINYMDLRHPRVKILYWFLFVFMLIVAFVCFAPPLWVMLSSMKDIKEFFMVPPTIIPRTFHPEKLVETWNKMNFWKYYLNTFEIAAGTISVSIVCNGLAGYVLSRLKPKGSSVIFMLILWSMMLPHSVSMVPVFKNIVSFPILGINLTNTFIPMWLMAGANAFYVIVFKSFFDGIPKSLIEAARLDGCTDFGIFTRIVLPLSKPVMMVIIIFSLNATWGDFLFPYLILKDTNMYTVMVKIFTMKGNGGYSMDLQMVALTFAIIPPAILFILFQKYIMQGFTLSGIKE